MTCSTQYPLLLVHGAGFRDHKHPNYWGRIPKALEARGAVLCYGRQDGWGSVEGNAAVIKASLEKFLAETGCEKVNIIAHSKGGLDARYMISSLGMAPYVASLTTMATPHHGSKTVDALLRAPAFLRKTGAFFMNGFSRITGDKKPDFYRASGQFSTEEAAAFNARNPDAPGVYYQSYTAVMNNACSDLLMFWPYLLVRLLEGESDGMVAPAAAQWGNFRGVLRGASNRGISHSDQVDIRRMNFTRKAREGRVSDMRQVYVEIVSELKQMGL